MFVRLSIHLFACSFYSITEMTYTKFEELDI